MRKFPLLSVVLSLALLLAACNLPSNKTPTPDPNLAFTASVQTVEAQLTQAAPTADLNVVYTAAAQTMEAQLTRNAPTVTSTFLPPPPTATPECDKAAFIADVTIPDGTQLNANETFTKTWRLKNIGVCTWTTAYALVFSNGDIMGGPTFQPLVGNVAPGQTVDISVNLKAPAAQGDYSGYWKLRNSSGVLFANIYVKIRVNPQPVFTVTNVSMTAAGTCGSFTITAAVTVNGPGEVTYKWKWSDGGEDTMTHAPIVFAAAGTKSVTTTWDVSAPGSYWVDIYIDQPNHQQFGRASFSCP